MTPKEAAVAVEKLLKDSGYVLGDLTFHEAVGMRIAKYDFSADTFTSLPDVAGNVSVHSAPVAARDTSKA